MNSLENFVVRIRIKFATETLEIKTKILNANVFLDNNYSGDGLVFDWSQKSVDAEIGVPEDGVSSQLNIDWEKYKNWDLVQITQNYMKLLLKYLQDNSSGLLIHCISGWDRTPLFVSLLRLSLWADGLIHQSLSAIQILYFTIGE